MNVILFLNDHPGYTGRERSGARANAGDQGEGSAIVWTKEHSDFNWSGDSGDGEKWWDPRYTLKVGPIGFAEGLEVGYKREKRNQD